MRPPIAEEAHRRAQGYSLGPRGEPSRCTDADERAAAARWCLDHADSIPLDHAGKIDEIDATCTVEWVLPRVLAKEQIQMMHDRLKTWCGTVDGTLGFLEGEAPELAAA